MQIASKERDFVSNELTFEWDHLKPYFENLKNRKIDTLECLKKWLKDRSELTSVLSEEFAWRYIRMNIDTNNETYQESTDVSSLLSFNHFFRHSSVSIFRFF